MLDMTLAVQKFRSSSFPTYEFSFSQLSDTHSHLWVFLSLRYETFGSLVFVLAEDLED